MNQQNRPTKARLAVLTALLSLTAAAQALAPAGASAVAPNPTAGGCKPVSAAYPGAVWNGLEFCAPEQPGEVIEFESWFNPCVRNPSLCTAYQPNQGGGPLQVGDGSGAPGPGQRGGAGKRAEAPSRKFTKNECRKIRSGELTPFEDKRLDTPIAERLKALPGLIERAEKAQRVAEEQARAIRIGLGPLADALLDMTNHPDQRRTGEFMDVDYKLALARRRLGELADIESSAKRRLPKLRDELVHLNALALLAQAAAFEQCRQKFGENL